jgi:hypothetical protein
VSGPSYAVDPAAHDAAVLAAVAELSAWARDAGIAVPDDHIDRLREALAADAPAPLLLDLDAAADLDADDLAETLSTTPPALAVQVLGAHGLLTPDPSAGRRAAERPSDRVIAVVGAMHAATGAPDLATLDDLLAGLGVAGLDATGLVATACTVRDMQMRTLAEGWPRRDLAAWVDRSGPALLEVEQRRGGDHAFSRPALAALLAAAPVLAPDVAERLYADALAPRAVGRADAWSALAGHPERGTRLRDALVARAAGTRTVAAEWLAAAPDTEDGTTVAALVAAVATEQDDAALTALLAALVAHGLDPAEHLDRTALEATAEKAAAKPLPASLAWLDPALLPPLTWADTGEPVPVATVRWWVQRGVKAKQAAPDLLVATMLAAVEPDGRRALADALLHLWLSAGAPTVSRGVLAVVSPGAGERVVSLAADFVRTRAKSAGTQAQALVALLARVDDPLAVQALVEAADSAGHAGVRAAATEEITALAERRGWTVEEVGDRGAPTAGFDASGRMSLSYGARTFTAVLQPDLKVLVEPDEGGKARTTLPPARASDDADQVAAAKATLAAAKKTVTATAKAQTSRLRVALATQRGWTVDAWRNDVAGHPVLGRLATGLVWAVGDQTFRPLDDGTLSDADDEPVDLDRHAADGTVVRLAHDVVLGPEAAAAWREHLADYEVAVPFAQLGDTLPPVDPDSTGLTDVVGAEVSSGALHRLAERAGFRRLVGDGGVVAAYARDLPDGLGAVLEVRGGSWVGDWSATVELGPLLFADGDGPVTLGSLPPVLLAEVRRDLVSLVG